MFRWKKKHWPTWHEISFEGLWIASSFVPLQFIHFVWPELSDFKFVLFYFILTGAFVMYSVLEWPKPLTSSGVYLYQSDYKKAIYVNAGMRLVTHANVCIYSYCNFCHSWQNGLMILQGTNTPVCYVCFHEAECRIRLNVLSL